MKKFQPTACIACESSTSSSGRQVRASTTSLSIAQCQDTVEEVLDCTFEPQSVEVLNEIIDLTPDTAPELEAQTFAEQAKDFFHPPTPPPVRKEPISRQSAGVPGPHRRAERGRKRSATTAPAGATESGPKIDHPRL